MKTPYRQIGARFQPEPNGCRARWKNGLFGHVSIYGIQSGGAAVHKAIFASDRSFLPVIPARR